MQCRPLSLIGVAALCACASAGEGHEADGRERLPARASVITEAEIQQNQATDLFSLINMVRPGWLQPVARTRGNTEAQLRGDRRGAMTGSGDLIDVFVDGSRVGNVFTLRDLPVSQFREVRRHTPVEARSLFSSVNPHALVVINAIRR